MLELFARNGESQPGKWNNSVGGLEDRVADGSGNQPECYRLHALGDGNCTLFGNFLKPMIAIFA